MEEVDLDHSGEIDYNEFIIASMNKQRMISRERLEQAFHAFDIDGNGTISSDELKQMLGKSHAYDENVWQELI